MVTNHGYTKVLRETNGAATKGMVNFAMLPGAYRNQAGFEPVAGTRTRLLSEGDTAAQPHATCRGVAALDAETAILGWQGADPFYNYVPFQATAAGLEDNPADWIGDVLALTGVDLATSSSPAAACTGLGGTYVPADETQSTVASLSSGSTHPLEEEIATLEAEIATLRAQVTQMSAEATTLQIDKAGTSSTLTAAAAGTSLKLTGPAGKAVTVRLLASNKNQAKKLGLKSRVLGSAAAKFGADAKALVKITPTGKPAAALKKAKGSVKVLFQAISGDRVVAIRGTLKK